MLLILFFLRTRNKIKSDFKDIYTLINSKHIKNLKNISCPVCTKIKNNMDQKRTAKCYDRNIWSKTKRYLKIGGIHIYTKDNIKLVKLSTDMITRIENDVIKFQVMAMVMNLLITHKPALSIELLNLPNIIVQSSKSKRPFKVKNNIKL